MELKNTVINRGDDNYRIIVSYASVDNLIGLALVMPDDVSMNAVSSLTKQEAKTLAYLLLAYAESIQE